MPTEDSHSLSFFSASGYISLMANQVYSAAWLFDSITPLLVVTLIVLVVYPPSRGLLFPPAPVALVSNQSGVIQKPKAGVLGSVDSATGAPENHRGEAVEQ
jgi:hypothetical protein